MCTEKCPKYPHKSIVWQQKAVSVASVLDSGAEGPGFKSQPRQCRVTVFGKLFISVVALFANQ